MSNKFENKVRIINVLRERGQISRPELSEILDINLPTISLLTKELFSEELIQVSGYEKSEGGRRPEILVLNPSFATSIGLELSLTGIRGILVDSGGNILEKEEGPKQIPEDSAEMIDGVLAVAESLMARSLPDRRPIGVGLAVAGLSDETGRISRQFPHRKNWKDQPLANLIETRVGVPVLLDNDVQAATLAERRLGAARGVDNVLYLHIGHGIACGIVVGGKLYTGATRNAGEFGHTIVDPAGPICYCGNYGCLESLAAPSAMVDQALQAIRKGVHSLMAGSDLTALQAEDILQAADKGDRLAANVVGKAAEYIGLGLANLVNFFNPNLVVFGGCMLVRGYRVFNETIERTFRARLLPGLQHETRVRNSELGTQAAALGGAMVVFEDLFDRPHAIFELARRRNKVDAAEEASGEQTSAKDRKLEKEKPVRTVGTRAAQKTFTAKGASDVG